jgi:NAD(P)-dependent dehydrogenase (short-subunit alcohol dehydrogenase family)
VAGRVAVVTGANRGIGLVIVRELARRGLRVVLTARDAVKGESARASLGAEGLEVGFHALDVRDARQACAAVARIEREFGQLDVLVNNAGVLPDPKGARAATVDPGVLRDALETNAIGALGVAQACLPLMRRGGYGRIVNVSSELGQLASMGTGTPAYRVSKAALNAITRTLAAELAGTNIKVNAMSPGWVRSDMGGPSAPRSLERGADTAVWLATLPDDGPSGGFFKDRSPIDW